MHATFSDLVHLTNDEIIHFGPEHPYIRFLRTFAQAACPTNAAAACPSCPRHQNPHIPLEFDMARRSTCRGFGDIVRPHPTTYTSEHACQNFCERLQRQIFDQSAAFTEPLGEIGSLALGLFFRHRKASIEFVERCYGNLLSKLQTVASEETIATMRTLKKVQRQIDVWIEAETLVRRGNLGVSLCGLTYKQERGFYHVTQYNPQVHLSVHAMARFMNRAKAPPQILIERLGEIAMMARLFSDCTSTSGAIAIAIPEGLIHGRVGETPADNAFCWESLISGQFDVERIGRVTRPRCEHGEPDVIDLMTFYPREDLNPHLAALYDRLLILQNACEGAAKVAYAIAFQAHEPTDAERACLAVAQTAVQKHHESDLHTAYRRRREDRETSAFVARLNREVTSLPAETAMMAAHQAALRQIGITPAANQI